MKVKIIMKSGNENIQDIKANNIEDIYAALHLDYDGHIILNKETIINTLEVAEVQII